MDSGSKQPKLLDTEAEVLERWQRDGITPAAEDDDEQRPLRQYKNKRTGEVALRRNGGRAWVPVYPPVPVPKARRSPPPPEHLTFPFAERRAKPPPLASFRDLQKQPCAVGRHGNIYRALRWRFSRDRID
jgi:hypothetical protein